MQLQVIEAFRGCATNLTIALHIVVVTLMGVLKALCRWQSCVCEDSGRVERLDDVLHLLRRGSFCLDLPAVFHEQAILLAVADVVFRAQDGCLGEKLERMVVLNCSPAFTVHRGDCLRLGRRS